MFLYRLIFTDKAKLQAQEVRKVIDPLLPDPISNIRRNAVFFFHAPNSYQRRRIRRAYQGAIAGEEIWFFPDNVNAQAADITLYDAAIRAINYFRKESPDMMKYYVESFRSYRCDLKNEWRVPDGGSLTFASIIDPMESLRQNAAMWAGIALPLTLWEVLISPDDIQLGRCIWKYKK